MDVQDAGGRRTTELRREELERADEVDRLVDEQDAESHGAEDHKLGNYFVDTGVQQGVPARGATWACADL